MNPVVAPMAWEDHYSLVCGTNGILNGQTIDQTVFTQMLSEARTNVESLREWEVLRAVDTSLQWSTGDTWQTAHSMANLAIPFGRWTEDLPIQVWDGNVTNPTILPVTIIPFDEIRWSYSTPYTAAIDYSTMTLYFCGSAGQNWTVILSYVGDYGDIVAKTANNNVATYWTGFNARYHKYLSFDLAARYRLGISYDDLAARNADDNGGVALRMLQAMTRVDARLKRTRLRDRDYASTNEPIFISHKINITRS